MRFFSLAAVLAAASSAQVPEFGACSIKSSISGNGGFVYQPNGVRARNVGIASLIAEAFGVQGYQVEGVPASLAALRFDLAARTDLPCNEDAERLMLRGVLIERFHLAVRQTIKRKQVFVLTVLSGGPKFEKAGDAKAADVAPRKHHEVSLRTDMPGFARTLYGLIRAPLRGPDGAWEAPGQVLPVVDGTGLKGIYRITVEHPPPLEGDLFTTWQHEIRKLGLTMVARKMEIAAVVVDRVERPSEN